MNLQEISALALAAKIKQRELSVKEAVQAVAEAVEAREPAYHCYAHFDKEAALRQAEKVQKGIDGGSLTSPLAGVPVAVKDNICTKGLETTCSSKMLTGFRPPYNATVIEKMNGAGLVTLGKLNMDEFAMGSTTETSAYGPTNNPWDVTRVPGGSSGGAAAAVAAGEAVAALGSDTGGSIRQPCSFCGVTGLKPTYGAVSRYGLIAYASSLDQIGPIARTVEDVAALYSIISGKDPKDGTSMPSEPFDLEEIRKLDVKGKKIGIPADYFGDGIAEDVANNVKAAAEVLKSLGAQVETFSMPIVKYAVPTYYIIACAEACSNLSRYDGIKYGYRTDAQLEGLRELYFKSRSEGFGMEVKKRIMLGNFVLSSGYYDAYYKKALQAKALIRGSFDKAFQTYDLLLGPVAPTTALKQGESLTDPLKMYLGDIYTVMINLAGLPSLALPCGFDRDGLPVGMQLIGRPLEEKTILQAGYAYQQCTEYHKQAPAFKQ